MKGDPRVWVPRWGARTLVALQTLVVANAVWLVAHADLWIESVAAVIWLAVVILLLVRLLRRYDRMSQPLA